MTTTTSENVANSIQQGVSPDTPTVITLKSLEQVDPLAEAVSSRPKLKHVKASDAGATKPLQAEEYFHGYLPAEAAQKTLSNKGDFLVRKVVVDRGREELLLSLVAGDLKVKHLKVIHSIHKKVYFLHNFCFDSPAGMIAYHLRKKIPVNTEGDLITKGVAREAWQLYHEQLYRRKKLGDGAFGEVWFGTLYQGIFKKTEVAIKMPLGKVTASEHEKLFQEAQLMRTLDHPHCIKLIGVAMYDEPLMIVMELAHGGSVLDAVKKKPGPSQEERIKYSIGALKGLAFLESRLVIHRDIAARNTLISAKGEAKISDFGLSILGAEHKEKRLQKVPVRYLAPETLSSGKYSSKSDVWSFGILLWEIFYDGREPYEDIVDPVEVKKQVKQGRHLLNSTNSCPKHLWDVATLCWTVKPDQRPSFAELMTTLGISDSPAPTRLVDQIAHKLHIVAWRRT
ncbi:hypothetical protein L596_023837 [Steinernema carpocapsae]|uniref:Tyrosine-protein kinase n=1 Tax=Steinernema carpocapsae TaxID=34508 RepID=A0A4U5MFM1_STECR|nr:hypothetical protein L596_023837 [Steinernema carpocapsae]